ncbi:MAG: HAD-IG family 5'-nucleotidase [Pseudomonadota bacterium]|nr:MAG: HAD family hydrolase [Pseudomonadota bacterium]
MAQPNVHPIFARESLALLEEGLESLLGRERTEVPGTRRIYVNRNLRMDQIDLVGFDMDHTLAVYSREEIEQLAFDLTVEKLVHSFGYPRALLDIRYDPTFVMRGLVIDKEHGNILKLDRFGYVGRAYHGRRRLPRAERLRLYRESKIDWKASRYAWMDTLFAMPEASIYAEAIEMLEGKYPLSYSDLYDHTRESIDTIHRDGSLKSIIQRDMGRYIERDPGLGPALHKLRSAGKRLFLLTNSLWTYTDAVMRHLLDGVLPEYPSWRNYFDFVVVGAGKPAFFERDDPFLELDAEGNVVGVARTLERGKAYQGGNLAAFERMTGFGGDRVLYVGDHIYGDILSSKKASLWRTCMIVAELEDELEHLDRHLDTLRLLASHERLRARLEDELAHQNARIAELERRMSRGEEEDAEAALQERQRRKRVVEALRRSLHRVAAEIQALSSRVEDSFNPHWGLMFKEGAETSRFGAQVEDYACLYTSRVSNFLFASPMQYFRSPRALMPHELGTDALAPFGSDQRKPGDTLRRAHGP